MKIKSKEMEKCDNSIFNENIINWSDVSADKAENRGPFLT
jgi:hypothetical protein